MGSIDAQYHSAKERPELPVVVTIHYVVTGDYVSNDGFHAPF